MNIFRGLIISSFVLGIVWALSRLGGEAVQAVGGKRENPRGSSFHMTRTFVCQSCGDTFPATPEEMTRRMDAQERVYPPDVSPDRTFFICEREGTPTLELIIDAQPNP